MAKAGKSKQPGKKVASKTRQRRAAKKDAHQPVKIPGSFRLTGHVFGVFRDNWKTLGGIMLVYLLINALFAGGISNFASALTSLKDNIGTDGSGAISGAFNGFASLLGGNDSPSGSAIQTILIIVQSLVIIWALRHLLAGKPVGVKQAYYNSMTPFIPFVLIMLVILLQLLPLTIGTAILGIVLSSVFNSDALVTLIFSVVFVAFAALSFYMLCSSVLALYIVTLPNMYPRQALRSAKSLVKFRRWQLMRRLVYLPLFIMVAIAAIVLPLVLLQPVLAVVAFYILATLSILFIHTYLYSLYRSLI